MLPMIVALMLAAPQEAAPEPKVLSDADLIAFRQSRYDQADKMFKHEVLGIHNGVRVLVDYPCSDLCPDYTTRIIHYDKPQTKSCAQIGGVLVMLDVPRGIGMDREQFCVPKVLAPSAP